jgi:ribokinase
LEALRAVDILLLNETEAAWLAAEIGTEPTAAALHAALGVAVIRTLGGEGVEAADQNGDLHLPAHDIAVVDSTAAGDCFAGVLAATLDSGASWEDALKRANLAAALCCTRPGSQDSLPTCKEIWNLSSKGSLLPWL